MIIPYHLSDNVSVVEKTFILQLTEMVANILTKVGIPRVEKYSVSPVNCNEYCRNK